MNTLRFSSDVVLQGTAKVGYNYFNQIKIELIFDLVVSKNLMINFICLLTKYRSNGQLQEKIFHYLPKAFSLLEKSKHIG